MDNNELKEFAAQKQRILQIIADQVEQAKTILMDAKRIATDAGLEFSIDSMVYAVNSGENWYNSNSTC